MKQFWCIFYHGLWTSSCFLRYFQKIILFKRSGILEDIYLSDLFIALRKLKDSNKRSCSQKQPFPDVYKEDILKKFLKLTGKHLYRSLYLMKLQPVLLLKKRHQHRCFRANFTIFLRTHFSQMLPWSGSFRILKPSSMCRYRNKDITTASLWQYFWLY